MARSFLFSYFSLFSTTVSFGFCFVLKISSKSFGQLCFILFFNHDAKTIRLSKDIALSPLFVIFVSDKKVKTCLKTDFVKFGSDWVCSKFQVFLSGSSG